MIGRRTERAALLEALDGGGRVVVLAGAPGIGKTTLVGEALAVAAQTGRPVLQSTGLAAQSTVGYAGLHELLHPLLPLSGVLPDRWREALLIAFGQVQGPGPDPLVLGRAAFRLLDEAAGTGPMLAVVEDLQWVDPTSRSVLDFVARRLAGSTVTLLATERTGRSANHFNGAGARRIELGPLTVDEAAEVLAATAPHLTGPLRRRVLSEAAGNPLALEEFGATAERLRGAGPLDPADRRLPTSRRLEQAFLGDRATLPSASWTLLLIAAAADETTSVADVLVARTEPADLASLEHAGLIAVEGGRLRFTHPLVRSAAYGAASASERAGAHRHLVTVATDPVRVAWHRAAAAQRLDEDAARGLETVAGLAGPREAVSALRRAAELSPTLSARTHRFALAAETARQAALPDESAALLREAVALAEEPDDVALLVSTEVLLGLMAGTPGRGTAEVIGLAVRLEPSAQRLRLLSAAIGRAWVTGAVPETAAAALSDEPPWTRDLRLALTDPIGSAPAVRRRLPAILHDVRAAAFDGDRERSPGSSQWLLAYAWAAESLQHLAAARDGWELGRRFHHEAGSAADEAYALPGRAMMRLLAGELTAGLADSEQALHLAEAGRLPRIAGQAAAISALAHARRGERAEAAARIADAGRLRGHEPYALITARMRWAAGLLALAEGRYADAWLELTEVADHPTTALWALADLAEAGARSGHAAAARDQVEAAAVQAEVFDSAHLWAIVHRARAVLASDEDAERHHRRAIAAAVEDGGVLEIAFSRLAFGEWLRRERRIVEAREPLGAALKALHRCGAGSAAERAVMELRAAGVIADAAAGVNLGDLSARELQIVRLAAAGLSNREIADQIYLSHRTVAAHLYRAFPKLGVASRAQLVEVLARTDLAGADVPRAG
ncbi:LuxR family transcriptional regulator [Actinoplanes sp. M2I2]|uniref:ATP-binding protein n=1 Tax=Actinoplanes sp. M2I2 TaxID=1734444 RepID=UPI00202034FD|nr:LuxR family transcriptional regulator [Actinoplanes sp. M2I2]